MDDCVCCLFTQCCLFYVTLVTFWYPHESCLQRQILLAPLPPHSPVELAPKAVTKSSMHPQSRPSFAASLVGVQLAIALCSGADFNTFVYICEQKFPPN